jgi:hypothetical protein
MGSFLLEGSRRGCGVTAIAEKSGCFSDLLRGAFFVQVSIRIGLLAQLPKGRFDAPYLQDGELKAILKRPQVVENLFSFKLMTRQNGSASNAGIIDFPIEGSLCKKEAIEKNNPAQAGKGDYSSHSRHAAIKLDHGSIGSLPSVYLADRE